MANRKHLLHVKSNVAEKARQYGIDDFLVTPKKPVDPTTGKATDDTLLYGEIAVNYGKGVEALTIRNTDDDVVVFVNENDFYEAGEITAAALATEKKEREEAEFVTSNALTYLDNKIDTSTVSAMVSTTYAEIKELREQSKLKAGQLYRITDYVTTTTQENTQSAGHVFDVIVLATDVDTLNENAKAIQHEGDTYFANSNLDAWEIKYDLDNDTTKYAWADETNGKGVIFYMKDEWNNECPYDFKNIQFKRWAITNITSTKLPTDALQELNNIFNFGSNGNKHFATKDSYGQWIPNSQGLTITVDETQFGWYYTFNGMSSEDGTTISNRYDLSTNPIKLTNECLEQIVADDRGTDTQDVCYDNKISLSTQEVFAGGFYYKGRRVLNNIVFNNGLSYCYYKEVGGYWEYKTCSCYGNTFEIQCVDNTFGNDCYSNTVGNNCYSNTFEDNCTVNMFGNSCHNNTFGTSCQSNSFGNDCYSNTFGKICSHNTFGNGCSSNTFGNYYTYNSFGGNDCSSNTFGNRCQYNLFGNNCSSNTLGENCSSNTLGNDCRSNTFGNDGRSNKFGNGCSSNTFGNSCSLNTFGNNGGSNSFGDNCSVNMFGNSCRNNTFGNYCYQNTFGNSVQYIKFEKDYTYNNIVENGNTYITVTSLKVTSSTQPLKNFTIAQGVNNATNESKRKIIYHAESDTMFKTIYQNANSKTVNV